jgi:hypothetical protein
VPRHLSIRRSVLRPCRIRRNEAGPHTFCCSPSRYFSRSAASWRSPHWRRSEALAQPRSNYRRWAGARRGVAARWRTPSHAAVRVGPGPFPYAVTPGLKDWNRSDGPGSHLSSRDLVRLDRRCSRSGVPRHQDAVQRRSYCGHPGALDAQYYCRPGRTIASGPIGSRKKRLLRGIIASTWTRECETCLIDTV